MLLKLSHQINQERITEEVKVSNIRQFNCHQEKMMRVYYLTIMERYLKNLVRSRTQQQIVKLFQEHQFRHREQNRSSIIWLNSNLHSKTEVEGYHKMWDTFKIQKMQTRCNNSCSLHSKMRQGTDHSMRIPQLLSTMLTSLTKLQQVQQQTVSIESSR